jgi:hypothetical protein
MELAIMFVKALQFLPQTAGASYENENIFFHFDDPVNLPIPDFGFTYYFERIHPRFYHPLVRIFIVSLTGFHALSFAATASQAVQAK